MKLPNRLKVLFALGFAVIFATATSFVSNEDPSPISKQVIAEAEKLVGLTFTNAERDSMLDGMIEHLGNYDTLRMVNLANSVPPAIAFSAILPDRKFNSERKPFKMSSITDVEVPTNIEDLAFYPVTHLAQLIKSQKVTSVQLTRMYLDRLKRYGPNLECVITLTEDLAMKQAKRADEEIAAGRYRGPLHGIPWGAKDLLATRNIKTTWGATPYEDQIINENATVVKRLAEAGAVLVAKLTMGALAWGDVWFGGKTRNPWNLEQGSSGSSAGPASATAAGLVGFSIGTETWGSIVSPSTRCGTTGMRPTYGRVSRHGAMALSWSMDKIGPICRSVEDCAIVFNAIHGPDGKDGTVVDIPFNWNPSVKLADLRIGYLKHEFERERTNKANDDAVLQTLRSLGATLIPIELPDYPVEHLSFILSAEAAAAFDEITRSNRDDLLVRQIKNAWPNVFRQARFIPAVEYIQANRVRTLVMQEMARLMDTVRVYVAPSFGGNNLLLTNLTGHPAVVVPNGFSEKGTPTSITFTGDLYDESIVLAVAKAYQDATNHHRKHPKLP
ncbi:MAG: amidase [Bacteroidota bacterium]